MNARQIFVQRARDRLAADIEIEGIQGLLRKVG